MTEWQERIHAELEQTEYQMMQIRGKIAAYERGVEEETQEYEDCEWLYRLTDKIIDLIGDAERLAVEFGTPARVH